MLRLHSGTLRAVQPPEQPDLAEGALVTELRVDRAHRRVGTLADEAHVSLTPQSLNDPSLRRLFGDSNADGTVDGTDFGDFGSVFGQTLANSPFDVNADGAVDGTDFGQFGARFGVTL